VTRAWEPVEALTDEPADAAFWGHRRGVHRPLVIRFWEKVSKSDGCWEWRGYVARNGYGRIGVGRDACDTHRVAWELSNGPIPEGLWVLHRCDNRRCVRPDHLFLGDNAANVQDMFSKRRRRQDGEHNTGAKLNWAIVVDIREWAAVGVSANRIAKAFGLDSRHVSRIVKGEAWRA
jgi:HNH endonuclease